MMRSMKSRDSVIALVSVCALVAALALCACGSSSGSGSAGSAGAKLKKDSDNLVEYTAVEEISYSDGIHHAELVFEGYEDSPLEIEIYAHSAWRSAERFCRLVDTGFYNGKPVFWILNEMYLRVGNTAQNDAYLIGGEYEDSDIKNSNSLKRGVIAMNRAADGQQSDAGSLIIFMSDLSFLDGKYAGFAKITENYEVIEDIANKTTSSDDAVRIVIDDNGRIVDEARYPHIKTITMID